MSVGRADSRIGPDSGPPRPIGACGLPVRLPRCPPPADRAFERCEGRTLLGERGSRAKRVRQRLPDAGPAAQAAVRPVHHRDLPARLPAPGAGRRRRQRAACLDDVGQHRHLRPDQPVLRRSAAPADRLRARDHALHHREHHPAAARRGDPAAGGAQEGGPGRPGQDHAVHPLPHPGLAILQATGIVALARAGNLLQGCSCRCSTTTARRPSWSWWSR